MSGIIIAFISGVLGPIMIILIKNRLDKIKKNPDMVMEALNVGELITSKIDHIRDEFKADRVWVTQFHNGGNFYPTGKSMAKFSIMYETVNSGVNSVQGTYNNIPVNLFSKSITQLHLFDYISIPDYKDETIPTYGLKYIGEDTNCKSSYLFAIKTIDDKFVGVLVVDYTKRKTTLDNESINQIHRHASTLGGVLIKYLHN